MQVDYKESVIRYNEHTNKWTCSEFDGEEFDSLADAKTYIDRKAKEVFTRVEVLKAGCYGAAGLGTITSLGKRGRAWFTPKKAERGYHLGRCLEDADCLYPVVENKELVDAWLKVEAEIEILHKKKALLVEAQGALHMKMKSYTALHPEKI